MEFDLLNLRPLEVTEAVSRDDIHHAMLRLRSRGPWNESGAPRATILEEIDDSFIHHRQHYGRLVGGGARGISSVRMVVGEGLCDITVDGSREWDPKAHAYSAKISFQNYPAVSTLEGLTWAGRARALLEDNVKVHCTCKAFQYYYGHTATVKGFALMPEAAPSPVTNPGGRGAVCKHLEHALRYLGANYSTIASAMKHQAQESAMHPLVKRMNDVLGESKVDEGGLANPASGGIVSDIDAIIAAAKAKGFSKTISVLYMARAQAGLEGGTGNPAPMHPGTIK